MSAQLWHITPEDRQVLLISQYEDLRVAYQKMVAHLESMIAQKDAIIATQDKMIEVLQESRSKQDEMIKRLSAVIV